MAKLYGEIEAKALLTLDKSFARANGQPLDASEVYYSKAKAEEYAATAQAYIGQKIVVIENDVVTHYSIEDAAGTLKELGAKPISDNKSIEVNGNTISIYDFGKAFYKYVAETETEEAHYEKVEASDTNPWKAGLEPKVVTEDGKLVIGWFEPNPTTIEGVNDQVTAVQGTVADLELAVGGPAEEGREATGLYKEVDDVKSDVADLGDAIYGENGTAEAPAEGSIAWSVDELDKLVGLSDATTGLVADVADIKENYAKKEEILVTGVAADDKVLALTDKVISATVSLGYDEDSKAIKLYGKDSVELGSVDATPFIKDGMLEDVSYNADNNTLTFKWNTAAGITEDTVVLSDIIEPYTAGVGLELVGNEFKAKLADGSESYLTITADGIKLSGIADAIATAKSEAIADAATAAAGIYATQAALGELETAIDGRLDVLEGHDHSTYATKDELTAHGTAADAKYATKDELKATDDVAKDAQNRVDIVEGKIDEITSVGGEPNVLEKVKVNGVTLEIEKDDEGNSTKSVNITVPTKASDLTDDTGFDARITAAQNQADKGVSDAAAAASAAAQAQSEVDALEIEVGGIQTVIAGHTTSITNYGTRIGALEQADITHGTEYNELKSIVSGHTSTIATLAKQTDLEAAVANISKNTTAIATLNETTIPGINTEIGKKANSADVYTKNEINAITGTLAEGKTIVQMIEDAKSEASYDDTSIKALIKSNTDAIAILNGDVNTAGSVAKIAADAAKAEVATVVGAAPEAMDTLEEVAAWIANDQSGAAAMASDIAANKLAIAAINNETTGILAVSKKYTDDAIAGLPAASASALGLVKVDDVTIKSTEGVISVKEVSTDLLVQGTQELILCGGTATK